MTRWAPSLIGNAIYHNKNPATRAGLMSCKIVLRVSSACDGARSPRRTARCRGERARPAREREWVFHSRR